MGRRGHLVTRVVAPLAFLLAATVAVLLARSAFVPADPVRPAGAAQVATTATTTTATTAPPASVATTAAAPAQEGAFHTVESGDTLAAIADEYGTSVEAIVALNPGIDPVALAIGQRIRVG